MLIARFNPFRSSRISILALCLAQLMAQNSRAQGYCKEVLTPAPKTIRAWQLQIRSMGENYKAALQAKTKKDRNEAVTFLSMQLNQSMDAIASDSTDLLQRQTPPPPELENYVREAHQVMLKFISRLTGISNENLNRMISVKTQAMKERLPVPNPIGFFWKADANLPTNKNDPRLKRLVPPVEDSMFLEVYTMMELTPPPAVSIEEEPAPKKQSIGFHLTPPQDDLPEISSPERIGFHTSASPDVFVDDHHLIKLAIDFKTGNFVLMNELEIPVPSRSAHQ